MRSFLIGRRYHGPIKGWLQSCVVVALATAFLSTATSGHSAGSTIRFFLRVSGTSIATTQAGSSIAIGDVFYWVATFDLNTPSTGSTPSFGNTFNNSLTEFSLTKSPENTGTWNPSDINWPITPASNVAANANGNNITVQLLPTNAPAINSQPFRDVAVSFGWNDADLDAIWKSGPTTLAEWLGTYSPNLNTASLYFELRDTDFNSALFSSTLTAASTTTSSSTTSSSTTSSSTTSSSTTSSSTKSSTTTTRITGQSTPTTTALSGSSNTTLPSAGDSVTVPDEVSAPNDSGAPSGLTIFIVLVVAALSGLLIFALRRRKETEE